MKFTDIFIRRPVLALSISLLIVLLGLQALKGMQVREYPKITNTVITVTTSYYGASANLIQGFITQPLEQAIAQADNIDYMTSKSQLGSSTITVNMKLNTDPNAALSDVLAKVNSVRSQLPKESEDPSLDMSTGSSTSIMYISFSSDELNASQITDYLERVIKPQLFTVGGVAKVNLYGGTEFALRIWLDPERMAAYNLTASEVMSVLQSNNYQSSPGQVTGYYMLYNADANTQVDNVADLEKLIVASRDKAVVRLRDIAKVSLEKNHDTYRAMANGKEAVVVALDPSPTANPLEIAASVVDMMPELQRNLPSTIKMEMLYDSTEAINESIDEVVKTIAEAGVIVLIVITLFLGSFRAVVIPIITIPLSLIGVVMLMQMFGFTINLMTLLAMVLAIGLVVDDAIVVVENVDRQIKAEEDPSPLEATRKSMTQITGALVGIALVLSAVFVPMAFFGGSTGAIYRQFSLTIVSAMVLSVLVALILTPALCATILKPIKHGEFGAKRGFFGWFNRPFDSSTNRRQPEHRRPHARPAPPLSRDLCPDRCRHGRIVHAPANLLPAGRGSGLPAFASHAAGRCNQRAHARSRQATGKPLPRRPEGSRTLGDDCDRLQLRRTRPERGDRLRQPARLERAQAPGSEGERRCRQGNGRLLTHSRRDGVRLRATGSHRAG